MISQDFSPFATKCSWKKRSSHQGKKEVACIVYKPLVSCLWGCGEMVNSPKLNIQEVQGALSSRPRPVNTYFSGFFTFVKSHTWNYQTSIFLTIIIHLWTEIARVIAPYAATSPEQLSLSLGQLIAIRKKNPSGWWEGELQVWSKMEEIYNHFFLFLFLSPLLTYFYQLTLKKGKDLHCKTLQISPPLPLS